jgi:hypothetical protein
MSWFVVHGHELAWGGYPSNTLPPGFGGGHPGNALPGYGHSDNSLPWGPGHPGNALPGQPGHPGAGLPWAPVRPDAGLPVQPGHPGNALPGQPGHPGNALPGQPGHGSGQPVPPVGTPYGVGTVPPPKPEKVDPAHGIWILASVQGHLTWAWAQQSADAAQPPTGGTKPVEPGQPPVAGQPLPPTPAPKR